VDQGDPCGGVSDAEWTVIPLPNCTTAVMNRKRWRKVVHHKSATSDLFNEDGTRHRNRFDCWMTDHCTCFGRLLMAQFFPAANNSVQFTKKTCKRWPLPPNIHSWSTPLPLAITNMKSQNLLANNSYLLADFSHRYFCHTSKNVILILLLISVLYAQTYTYIF